MSAGRASAIVLGASFLVTGPLMGLTGDSEEEIHRQLGQLRLEQFDKRQIDTHQAIWNVYLGSPAFGVDLRGRNIADDIGSMSSVSMAKASRLEAERALHAGQIRKFRQIMENLEKAQTAQVIQMNDLMKRWNTNAQIAHNQELWNRFLEANRITDPPPRDPVIEHLEQRVRTELDGNPAWSSPPSARKLLRAYAKERGSLARSLGKFRIPDNDQLAYRLREMPCGTPVSGDGSASEPSHAASEPPIYPPESRRRHEEGVTILRIRVSATGCVAAAAVFISSGSPLLDNAALEWIENASFYPARLTGEPVEALTNVAIDFRIQDE